MEPGTDQCTNNPLSPVSFLGVTYRHMSELLLMGAEMTQSRCIHHQGPPPTPQPPLSPPPPHPTLVITHKRWEPGASSQPEGSAAGWRVSFQGAPIGLNLFQAVCLDFAVFHRARLVWASSLKLHFYYLLGKAEPSESGQFQGLPEALLSCLTSGIRSFPCRIECFNLPRNCYTSLAWTSSLTHSLK